LDRVVLEPQINQGATVCVDLGAEHIGFDANPPAGDQGGLFDAFRGIGRVGGALLLQVGHFRQVIGQRLIGHP